MTRHPFLEGEAFKRPSYHEVVIWPVVERGDRRIHLQVIGEEVRGLTLCGEAVKGFANAESEAVAMCPRCYRERKRRAQEVSDG